MSALKKIDWEDSPADGTEEFVTHKNTEKPLTTQSWKDKTLERLYPILDDKISPLVSNNQNMKEIFEQKKEAIFQEFFASGILPEGELWEYMQDNMRDFYTCAFGYGFRFLDKLSHEDRTKLSQTDAMNLIIQQISEALIHRFEPKRLYREYNFCIRYAPFMLSQLNFLIHLQYIRLSWKQGLHHFLWEFLPDNISTLSEITSCLDWLSSIIWHHYIPGWENNFALEILNEKRTNIANSSKSAFVHFLMKNYSKNNSSLNICISKESYKYFWWRILNGYKPREFHEITLTKKYTDNLDDDGKRETLVYENFCPIPIIKISTDRALKLDSTLKTPYSFYCIDNHGALKEGGEHGKLFDNYDFPPESKEDYQYLIQLLHRPDILFHIETSLWIQFSDYPFSIQPPFLQFLAYATLEDFARVREFLAGADNIQDKYCRLRLFLATTEKPDPKKPNQIPITGIILNLEWKLIKTYSRNDKENGEQKWKDMTQRIFKKYSEVMDIINEEADKIQKSLLSENTNLTFKKAEFAKKLLWRANSIVLREFDEKAWGQNLESIDMLFEECRVDLLQFGSLFHTLKGPLKEGGSLQDALVPYDIQMSDMRKSTKLTVEEQEQIRSLYVQHYRTWDNFEAIMKIVDGWLEEDKLDPNVEYTFFYYKWPKGSENMKPGQSAILTIKFAEKNDGSVYVGAFNSDLMMIESSFWTYVFGSMLEKYEGREINWTVIEGSEHLLDFYKKFKFETDRVLHEIEGSTVHFYKIQRPGNKE